MENKCPLVTSVITTYKRNVETVERAVRSVIYQDYNEIELIVVNDYPTDHSLSNAIGEMLNKYSNCRMIKYIIVEKNGGACKARNIAAKEANGKYIAFLDDDDEWLSNKISSMVTGAENNPEAGLIYCNSLSVYGVREKKNRFSDVQPSGNIFFRVLGQNIIGSCSFPMFQLKLFKNCGGFNEDMPAFQDWELYLRVLKSTQALYIDKVLAVYHFYSGERISTNSQNRLIAYEKIKLLFKNDLKQNKNSSADFYLMGTYFYGVAGKHKQAFKYWCLGVRCNPFRISNFKALVKMIGRIIIKPKYV